MIDQEHTNTNEHKTRLSNALRFCAIPNYKQSPTKSAQLLHIYGMYGYTVCLPCPVHVLCNVLVTVLPYRAYRITRRPKLVPDGLLRLTQGQGGRVTKLATKNTSKTADSAV